VPSLSLSALRTHIQGKKCAPVYLFFGDDVRLMEQMVDAIEATIEPAERPFAIERLYAGEEHASPLDVAASANVFPMLGDRRIVIVLRAERFLKPKRAGKSADAGDGGADEPAADEGEGSALDTVPLEDYLDRPAPSTVLVFVAAGIDRTRRLTKRLLDKAACVEFAGLAADNANERREAHREAVTILQQEFAANGRGIEPAAIEMIVSRAGGDISKLRGDVERLMLYTDGRSTITRADVEEVVAVETEVDDWAVVNAIGDGGVCMPGDGCVGLAGAGG